MSPTAILFRPEHQLSHAGAVGTPVVNVQVAIMDEDGTLLPQGEEGEIVYRGPHALTGYLDDADGHRGGLRARLVPLRGHRAVRRRRDVVVHRPAQGRHQDRRRERRLDRGGEGALRRRPGHRGGGRRRAAARAVDRGGHRDRGRRGPARDARRADAAAPRAGAPGRVQGAEGGHRRLRAAADLHRQDPEERAARRSTPTTTTSPPGPEAPACRPGPRAAAYCGCPSK